MRCFHSQCVAAFLALLSGMAFAQVKVDEPSPNTIRESTCIDRARVAHDAMGNVSVLSVKQLNRMADHRPVPKMPSSCRCEGTVVVKVVVDELGHVACVMSVYGHPLLLKSVMDALQSWHFRPYRANGKQTPVVGLLAFRFSSSATKLVRLDESVRAMPVDRTVYEKQQ